MARTETQATVTSDEGEGATRFDRLRPWLLPGAVVGAIVLGVVLWLTQPWLLFVDVVAEESLPISIEDATGTADAGADDGATDDGGAGDEAAAGDMGTTPGEPDGATRDGATAATDTADDDASAAADDADDADADDDTTADDPGGTAAPTGPVVLASGSFISRDHGTSGTAAIVRLEDGSRVLTIEDLDTDNGPDLFVYLDDTPADGPEGDFDDGVSLGRLRANQGDLVYEIPDEVDLERVLSVGIWCDRFSSLFGAADLVPVG